MTAFDECIELRRSINEIDEKILSLRETIYSPRNQVISGMPRGGGSNAIEQYLIKVDKLIDIKNLREKRLSNLWNETVCTMQAHGIKEEYINLMYYRFYLGLPWKHSCSRVQENYTSQKWNENRVFRVYRMILSKIH